MRPTGDSGVPRLLITCGAMLLLPLAAIAQQRVADTAELPRSIRWSACRGDAPITLDVLARGARPVLWFSPDEPLMLLRTERGEDGSIQRFPMQPQEWPRLEAASAATPVVYYRVKRLKSTGTDDALGRLLEEKVRQRSTELPPGLFSGDLIYPELIAHLPLDDDLLNSIKEIAIRYLFYYPKELGVGQHPHDLESIEMRFKVEDANALGNPWADDRPCRQIRLATLYGAAHGLGAYTNVLDLDAVLKDNLDPNTVKTDPFWPMVVFVEEGKHASAPDRNGDGAFTPSYDVNRFATDAWGVRDTMRSRVLSAAFSSDVFKRRIPPIESNTTATSADVLPAEDSRYAHENFTEFVRYEYETRRPTVDVEMCGPIRPASSESDRKQALQTYARALKAELSRHGDPGNPERKLEEKAFCSGVELDNAFDISDVGHSLNWGGARTSYSRFLETLTFSMREDLGLGWAAILPPLELAIPGIEGRVVGRLSSTWPGEAPFLKSLDALYMRSAARFADWYISGGADGPREEEGVRVSDWSPAFELGVRFRFPVPNLGVFLGGRVGIRANGWPELGGTRIVYELGTGIW